jgi:hypothetical protein
MLFYVFVLCLQCPLLNCVCSPCCSMYLYSVYSVHCWTVFAAHAVLCICTLSTVSTAELCLQPMLFYVFVLCLQCPLLNCVCSPYCSMYFYSVYSAYCWTVFAAHAVLCIFTLSTVPTAERYPLHLLLYEHYCWTHQSWVPGAIQRCDEALKTSLLQCFNFLLKLTLYCSIISRIGSIAFTL